MQYLGVRYENRLDNLIKVLVNDKSIINTITIGPPSNIFFFTDLFGAAVAQGVEQVVIERSLVRIPAPPG